jgi:hypothetical protein
MRNKLFGLLVAAFCCSATTQANIINVANPGNNADIQPNLQAAVNSAQNGDQIIIPAGQFVVNKNVLITKFISIKGAGLTQTILYRSQNATDSDLSNNSAWDGILNFTINSTVSSGIQVTGICFKSKTPSITAGDGGSLAADIGVKMVGCVNFVISDCRFQYFGTAGVYVVHDDSIVGGLIQKNQFYHNAKGFDALGLGYGVVVFGTNTKWITNPRLGTSNFIFVEDNTFDFHRHSIAAGGCGLYVFRHNTVHNNIAGGGDHAVDAHAARKTPGLNYYGTRAVEVYDDTIVNTTFSDGTPIIPGQSAQKLSNNGVLIKSGDALIHDNYIQGFRFGVGIIDDVVSGTQPYPIFTAPGYLSGLWYGTNHTGVSGLDGDGDLFAWNTTFTPYAGSYSSSAFYNFQPQYFVQERDYHLYAKPAYTTYTYPHPLGATVRSEVFTKEVSVYEIHPVSKLLCYPNPATDLITIESDQIGAKASLEVMNLSGQIVRTTETTSSPVSLDVSNLTEGIYFIRVISQEGVQTSQIIVKHNR